MREICPSGSGSGEGKRGVAQSMALHRAPSRLHHENFSIPLSFFAAIPRQESFVRVLDFRGIRSSDLKLQFAKNRGSVSRLKIRGSAA